MKAVIESVCTNSQSISEALEHLFSWAQTTNTTLTEDDFRDLISLWTKTQNGYGPFTGEGNQNTITQHATDIVGTGQADGVMIVAFVNGDREIHSAMATPPIITQDWSRTMRALFDFYANLLNAHSDYMAQLQEEDSVDVEPQEDMLS